MLIYLHLSHSIIPNNTSTIELKFQHFENSGPYSFLNITTISKDLINPWKDANTNAFTKIEQNLDICLNYINLNNVNKLGGLRMTVFKDSKRPIFIKNNKLNSWPFKDISNFNDHELSLFRVDRSFNSWEQITNKSYSKNVLFLTSYQDSYSPCILEYFLPSWVINTFVPNGIQKLINFNNLKSLLSRNGTGDGSNMQICTEFITFENELKLDDLVGTNMLIELNLQDIFINSANMRLNYKLNGLRWWIYWWPGACLLIGVTIIWFIEIIACISVSWIGYFLFSLAGKTKSNKRAIEKNLNELMKF